MVVGGQDGEQERGDFGGVVWGLDNDAAIGYKSHSSDCLLVDKIRSNDVVEYMLEF